MTKRRGVKRNLKKTKRRYKKNLGKTKRRYMSKKGGGDTNKQYYVLNDNKTILKILKELFYDCKFIKCEKLPQFFIEELNNKYKLHISPLFFNLDSQNTVLGKTLEELARDNNIKHLEIIFEPSHKVDEEQLIRFNIAFKDNRSGFGGTSLNKEFNEKLQGLLIEYNINT